MKPKKWTATVACTLFIALVNITVAKEKSQQPAHITVYSDPQSFFQAAKVVSTETFDQLPSRTVIGVGSVSLDEVTYTSADASAEWFTDTSFVTVSPPNGLTQRNVIAPATLTFAGGGHTDAVGFFLLPGSTFPGGDYRFDITTTSGDIFSVDTGTVTETIFRGVVSSDGSDILSLSITPLNIPGQGESISNFELDNVSRGSIEPAFAGVPGKPNCFGRSVSALARQYGGLNAAAAALGFPSVQALQEAIREFCEA
jgi:hypothetical protein